MKLREISVLLVEDDDDDFVLIRELISDIKGAKFNVTRVISYNDGLAGICSGHYQVCLLDYRLGQHTGLELLAETSHLENRCPIVLLTGQGDMSIDIEAMEAGAADYLVKDRITSEILGRTIRYTLKQADDLLRLQEQTNNFKVLFNSTFEGILVHKDDKILDANQACASIFGLDPEVIIGHKISSLFCVQDRPTFDGLLNDSLKSRVELFAFTDGEEIPIELSTREVSLRGRQVYLSAVQDLRERKQMEAQLLQQDRLASLGLLASSLAHEIGTPMGVIRGRAEMVAFTSNLDTVKIPMEMIISQIDRITNLMHSVLQLARGKQTETVTDVAILPGLNDVLQLLNHEFQKKSISLRIGIAGAPVVRAEPGPLGQIFLNILVNALYAIDEAQLNGSKTEHFISVNGAELDGEYELRIQDSGNGISSKNLSSLFKPFFSTKPIGSGTGLGLAICYKILQSWGGSIRAESPAGSGAVFIMRFKRRA
jgi:PAS domain S-box-containing protein